MNAVLTTTYSQKYGRANLPPMLTQYLEFKDKYPDCLLFCQVGDFYELFFDDAKIVSSALNLTLTSRDKNSEDPIPMCGVPLAVVDGYVDRLVDLGYSVAIVSQAELASQAKGMVKRELERIITPGVRLLGKEGNNSDQVVASLFTENEQEWTIAFSDVQTGTVYIRENLHFAELKNEFSKINVAEVILSQSIAGKKIDRRQGWLRELEQSISAVIKYRADNYLDLTSDARAFTQIEGYSSISISAKKCIRLLINYIDETTVNNTVPVYEIITKNYEDIVSIDANTQRNLELIKNIKDNTNKGTLFAYMNRTKTSGGAKLLRGWITSPLLNVERINERQQAIELLIANSSIRFDAIRLLEYMTDIERIAARIELTIVSPKELAALRNTLQNIPQILNLLNSIQSQAKSIAEIVSILSNTPHELIDILAAALSDNPPMIISEGGIFAEGYNGELDHLREIKHSGKSWIAELEATEREKSGIGSLKIKYNNVLGYFFETTKLGSSKVPDYFINRQSTANTERYFTTELKDREKELLGADQKQIDLEKALYDDLKKRIRPYTQIIKTLAKAISTLDVFISLAELAENEALIKPEINASKNIDIKQGKHPILARMLQSQFIANDVHMSKENCLVLTGPNMGGKSTYLRQAALIVVMAQIGSYIPAQSASIGIVDKIFTRLGASDDLIEGESTFMVEMRETAFIVSNATDRSLLLVDEIGRGTATTDGLAIAQAVLEWIATKIKCRTIFATHFRELTALEREYPNIANISVSSIEKGKQVIFTHQIQKGAAPKSYGIEVAKLAGLPQILLQRASFLLTMLDKQKDKLSVDTHGQLNIFANIQDNDDSVNPFENMLQVPDDYDQLLELKKKLDEVNINELTPIDALNILASLKKS